MSKNHEKVRQEYALRLDRERSSFASSVERYSKRAQRGQQSATEHEELRQQAEFYFGSAYAKFFDVYGCLPYDRKSWYPGYPTNYLERRLGGTISIGIFSFVAILCFVVLPPEVLHVGERAITAIGTRMMISMVLSALITTVVLMGIRRITPKNLAIRNAYYEKFQELETLNREAKEAAARRARDERLDGEG